MMKITHCSWQIGEKRGMWPPTRPNSPNTLPPMIKRRLTPLGRQAIDVLYACSTEQKIPWVVACQHAEASRKVRLLSALAKKELISPTDFSMSVHNAIIGTFSIATQNKQLHTAIAGGDSSFAMGLVEAFALQKDKKGKVGYIYYDALIPTQYAPIYETDYPIVCFAMVLDDQEGALQIEYVKSEAAVVPPAQTHKIASLVDYLYSDEKTYEIPVFGANIRLAHLGL